MKHIALALLLTVTAAQAQDPYAKAMTDQRAKVFEQQRDDYLRGVKLTFFAFACQANIPPLVKGVPYTSPQMVAMGLQHLVFGRYPFMQFQAHPQLRADSVAASQSGIDEAKLQGCSYWTEHPDAVYDFRQIQASALATLH